jgi:hypothetical protein
MSIKDLASRTSSVQVIGPATFSATQTSSAIDGFQSAVVEISVGAGGITFDGTNNLNSELLHSDDGTNWVDVAASDINGRDAPATITGGVVLALKTAHPNPSVAEVGYIGGKRYLQVKANFNGTHGTGTPISAIVVKGNPLAISAA